MNAITALLIRLDALEARFDAVKRKCKTGYSCGNTCISVQKECRSEAQGSLSKERAERLAALAQGQIKPKGIGRLKSEQAAQLALEIRKFQRTGIKPPWYTEPSQTKAAADELDTTTADARMAFVRHMRDRSISRPDASYTGNTLAAATLALCDQPGEVGRNARRMAKFLMDSNVLTVVDGISPNLRPGAKADAAVGERDVKHLLQKDALQKAAANNPTLGRVSEHIKYNTDLIKSSRKHIKNIREGMKENQKMGWDTPQQMEHDKKRLQRHEDTIRGAKESLAISYRTVAISLMGKPSAAGTASRQGILRMRDDPAFDTPWDPNGLNPESLTAGVERHLGQYGKPGYKNSSIVSAALPTRNEITMNTFIHEVGHMIHFASGDARNTVVKLTPALESNVYEEDPDNPLGSLTGPTRHFMSDYAKTNRLEMFAEAFTAFVAAPAALRKRSPEVYEWVDDVLTRAQSTPKLEP